MAYCGRIAWRTLSIGISVMAVSNRGGEKASESNALNDGGGGNAWYIKQQQHQHRRKRRRVNNKHLKRCGGNDGISIKSSEMKSSKPG